MSVYYYQVKENETICLYRVFGSSAIVEIPSMIDGKMVTEIGDYCFSQNNKEYTKYTCSASTSLDPSLKEQAGKDIEEILLPDTITKLGNCAFYNCRYVKKLTMSKNVESIGSDCFMNCLRLNTIDIYGDLFHAPILKSLIRHITWDVTVYFKSDTIDAALFFPEYYDTYDEIGPAHLFSLNINGEGFRCRQCFDNTSIQLDQYDATFEKLKFDESERVLTHFACNRIFYPVLLQEHYKNMYIQYLKEHAYMAGKQILHSSVYETKDKLHMIQTLIKYDCIDSVCLNKLLEDANKDALVELSVELASLKKRYFNTRKTYDFEDF